MSGFVKDDFGAKILSMYSEAKENNYILKLDGDQVEELRDIYKAACISPDKLGLYTEEEITKKMMTSIVSVYDQEKEINGSNGEVLQLVNTVKFDGRNMYLEYAKISAARMRRLELGKSRKEVADTIGYGVAAVKNCESMVCDLSKQPQILVEKLAKALECKPETLL